MKRSLVLAILSIAFNFTVNAYELLPLVPLEITKKAVEFFYKGSLLDIRILVEADGFDPNFSYTGKANLFHYVSNTNVMDQVNNGEAWTKLTPDQAVILKYLKDKGADINRFDGEKAGVTPLFLAISGNLTSRDLFPVNTVGYAEWLILNGANVNFVELGVNKGTAWEHLDYKSEYILFDLIAERADFFNNNCNLNHGTYSDRKYLKRHGVARPSVYNYARNWMVKNLNAPTNDSAYLQWLEDCELGVFRNQPRRR